MINLVKDKGIYTLTLNQKDNTFCVEWQAQMLQALTKVERDYSKGSALIVTGEGKFFSNGVNLDALNQLDNSEVEQFAQTMLEIHRRLLILPCPTVAAINGHAFAGGAFLALSLDYRIMRQDRGWISISEVDAGVPIPATMMEILHTKLPPVTARDAVLTGKRYTAEQAMLAGLIDYTASSEALLSKAGELATALASKEPGIFKTIKQTFYEGLAARLV
jgi:enoyl-CoA hydratase/carnithine racemase